MNTELAALAGLAAFILALSALAAFFWLRERRAKREAMRRAYAHGLSGEAARRSGVRHGRGGRGTSSSSPSSSSDSDAGYGGAFVFPGLGDTEGGRSDHSEVASPSSSHSSCSSSSCSSSSCGGGGGD